jgi:hypothetical protein
MTEIEKIIEINKQVKTLEDELTRNYKDLDLSKLTFEQAKQLSVNYVWFRKFEDSKFWSLSRQPKYSQEDDNIYGYFGDKFLGFGVVNLCKPLNPKTKTYEYYVMISSTEKTDVFNIDGEKIFTIEECCSFIDYSPEGDLLMYDVFDIEPFKVEI